MIVLWVLSMVYVVAVSIVAATSNRGRFLARWVVVALFLMVLVTLIWMGVQIWLKN